MSGLEQLAKRHTRLSDFGAFQFDVSTQPTLPIPIVNGYDGIYPDNIREIPSQGQGKTGSSASVTLLPPASSLSTQAAGSAIIIPFPKPEAQPRGQHWQDASDQYQQRGNGGEEKGKRKKWISFTLRAGFTVALFVVLFKSLSWQTLFQTLTHAHRPLVLIGLTVGAFGLVVSAYQWRSLLHLERIHFDLAKLINLYMVGIAFSHFLPTGMGGDAIKAIYVGRDSGNTEGSASAVIMSRVTGFFGMLAIASLVLIIWHNNFSMNIVIAFVLLSLLVGGLIFGAVFSTTLLPRFIKGKWAQFRIFATAIRIGRALSATMKKPRSLLGATAFGILFWVSGCLNYYCYGLALGLHVHLYFYLVAVPFVSLITFLPISINGFGVRESAFVYVFSTIHISTSSSLLLALLMDTQVLFFGILGGSIYFVMNSKVNMIKQRRVA